jgi:hypothetical protein
MQKTKLFDSDINIKALINEINPFELQYLSNGLFYVEKDKTLGIPLFGDTRFVWNEKEGVFLSAYEYISQLDNSKEVFRKFQLAGRSINREYKDRGISKQFNIQRQTSLEERTQKIEDEDFKLNRERVKDELSFFKKNGSFHVNVDWKKQEQDEELSMRKYLTELKYLTNFIEFIETIEFVHLLQRFYKNIKIIPLKFQDKYIGECPFHGDLETNTKYSFYIYSMGEDKIRKGFKCWGCGTGSTIVRASLYDELQGDFDKIKEFIKPYYEFFNKLNPKFPLIDKILNQDFRLIFTRSLGGRNEAIYSKRDEEAWYRKI